MDSMVDEVIHALFDRGAQQVDHSDHMEDALLGKSGQLGLATPARVPLMPPAATATGRKHGQPTLASYRAVPSYSEPVSGFDVRRLPHLPSQYSALSAASRRSVSVFAEG